MSSRVGHRIAAGTAVVAIAAAGAVGQPGPARADSRAYRVSCFDAGTVRNQFGYTYPAWGCPLDTAVQLNQSPLNQTPVGYLFEGGALVVCQQRGVSNPPYFGLANDVWLYTPGLAPLTNVGRGWLPATATGAGGYQALDGVALCEDVVGFDGWGINSPV